MAEFFTAVRQMVDLYRFPNLCVGYVGDVSIVSVSSEPSIPRYRTVKISGFDHKFDQRDDSPSLYVHESKGLGVGSKARLYLAFLRKERNFRVHNGSSISAALFPLWYGKQLDFPDFESSLTEFDLNHKGFAQNEAIFNQNLTLLENMFSGHVQDVNFHY